MDTLYIACHGAGYPGSGNIGAKRFDGNLKKYTQEELATVLVAEGLTPAIREIHMLTCGSGLMNANVLVAPQGAKKLGVSQVRDPRLQPRWTYRESVARQLCNALKNKGYRTVRVTGYLGDIIVYPNRVTIEEYYTEKEVDLSWKVVAC